MITHIDDKRFWTVVPRSEMWRVMERIEKDYPGDKKIVIINNEAYRNANGYKDLAKGIDVDYTKDNLIIVEM